MVGTRKETSRDRNGVVYWCVREESSMEAEVYIKHHRESEPRLALGRDGGWTGGHTGLPKPPVSLGVESWFP